MKIAILGSNSHIAKGLIWNFLEKTEYALYLFTRTSDKVRDFLRMNELPACNVIIEEGYQNFPRHHYDIVINCVGAGTPKKLDNNYSNWFVITEKFDNLVIEYLLKNKAALYVNFSSGAVYGNDFLSPAKEDSVNGICVNHVPPGDYYSIARLNSEAKHRSFAGLNIIDLRIFSYFSRFIDLSSGYLVTEIVNCTLNKKMFKTNNENIVRDYVHPDDLFSLVIKCVQKGNINLAFDVVSAKPAEKFQILEHFSTKHGLKYDIDKSLTFSSPNGAKNVYCSEYNKAIEIGYAPVFSSINTIEEESIHILKGII